MNVRLRRLAADYEIVQQALAAHPRIRIQAMAGSPPEKYQIAYQIRSLEPRANGQTAEREQHLVEVFLTTGYPRQAPQCRMLTPIFHPNIAPHAVCIGDHWAAGESLAHLIVRIGEMLAYQSYNTKSPLNGEAARWADQNQDKLPLDAVDLTIANEPGPPLDAAKNVPEVCANCGVASTERPLSACDGGHLVCAECGASCATCGGAFCVVCGLRPCASCGREACPTCLVECHGCRRSFCKIHRSACRVCQAIGCADCVLPCAVCEQLGCLDHVRQCAACQQVLCPEHARTCDHCGQALCPAHCDPTRHRCGPKAAPSAAP